MPLILSRRRGETITVSGPALFRIVDVRGDRATVEIIARPEVEILRGELKPRSDALPKRVNGKWRYPKRRSRP